MVKNIFLVLTILRLGASIVMIQVFLLQLDTYIDNNVAGRFNWYGGPVLTSLIA